MPKDTKVERKKGDSVSGETDYERLRKMTEREVEQNAKDAQMHHFNRRKI